MTNKRFAVVVRYEQHGTDIADQKPDVWWHHSPAQAAKRLAAIINGKASWVPKHCRVGKRFYIVDHGVPTSKQAPGVCYPEPGRQYALNDFRTAFGLGCK